MIRLLRRVLQGTKQAELEASQRFNLRAHEARTNILFVVQSPGEAQVLKNPIRHERGIFGLGSKAAVVQSEK